MHVHSLVHPSASKGIQFTTKNKKKRHKASIREYRRKKIEGLPKKAVEKLAPKVNLKVTT